MSIVLAVWVRHGLEDRSSLMLGDGLHGTAYFDLF